MPRLYVEGVIWLMNALHWKGTSGHQSNQKAVSAAYSLSANDQRLIEHRKSWFGTFHWSLTLLRSATLEDQRKNHKEQEKKGNPSDRNVHWTLSNSKESMCELKPWSVIWQCNEHFAMMNFVRVVIWREFAEQWGSLFGKAWFRRTWAGDFAGESPVEISADRAVVLFSKQRRPDSNADRQAWRFGQCNKLLRTF